MSPLGRPLVAAFAAYLAGLLFGLRHPASPYLFAAAAASLALLALSLDRSAPVRPPPTPRTGHAPRALLLLLAALASAGVGAGAAARHAMLSDCRQHLADGATLRVEGVLLASVMPGALSEAFTPRFPVRATRVVVDGRPVAGCTPTLRVALPPDFGGALAGASLEATGRWRAAPRPPVPSRWPRDPRWTGSLYADAAALAAPPSWAAAPLLTLRGRAERNLHSLFPRHGPLADALLLGRRETLDPLLRERYTRAGLVHLLAISGAHVGLVAGMLLLVGRAAGLPHRRVGWLAIGLIALYLLVIGAPASALRAGTMITLALLATLWQRPTQPLTAVAAAVMLILAAAPAFALDIGFQLSVAGVVGILLTLRWLEPRLRALPWSSRALRGALRAVAVSFGAFLATAPIVGYHFGQLAPVSLVSNLPAMPLMAVALTGVALAAVLGPVAAPLASLFADGAGLMLDALDRVAALAAAVPGGYLSVTRGQVWSWLIAAAAAAVAVRFARRMRTRVRATLAVGAAALVLVVWPVAGQGGGGALEIHFIDVGQGDAVAIRSPRGRWALVDAGPRTDRFDAGERRVLPYLRAHGARALELLVVTHPHLDHMGGAPALMRAMPVRYLVEPGRVEGHPAYLEMLETAAARGTAWRAARTGRTVELDGVELRLLWPDSQVVDAVSDANEISVVVQLRYGAFSALFTGDASADVERLLVDRHGDALRAQVLKAGHHGSITSTAAEWLDVVRPELVVVSAGRGNRYGHPAPEVVKRLAERGIELARTDLEGSVSLRVVSLDGRRWSRIEP